VLVTLTPGPSPASGRGEELLPALVQRVKTLFSLSHAVGEGQGEGGRIQILAPRPSPASGTGEDLRRRR